MGSITIRNLSDGVKESARIVAATNGRSLESEIRTLLERTYTPRRPEAAQIRNMPGDDWVHEVIELAGGVGLDLPTRHDPSAERESFGAD